MASVRYKGTVGLLNVVCTASTVNEVPTFFLGTLEIDHDTMLSWTKMIAGRQVLNYCKRTA